LIPIILLLIFFESIENIFIALILYSISALTDYFDGKLARRLNQKSEFGEYFDPLADKVLVWSVFTILSFKTGLYIPFWLIVFLYIRDFYVTWLRTYSKKKKITFKTSMVAKAKTMVQMIVAAAIICYIFLAQILKNILKITETDYAEIWKRAAPGFYSYIVYIPFVLTFITVVFTLYTAYDYYRSYRRSVKNE
jgi:CDP-diacylglycerol--glycerol-3-phosphate 3-phosphatidyltransferase